jgi:hypothetical protein
MTKTPFTRKSGHTSVDIITLIDDHSRYGYVYLIYKKKSKSIERFKEFRSEVEKQTGKNITIL